MKDMTSGDEAKLIARFMLPLLAGAALQQFYGIVDSIVVGRVLGKDALAAVGGSLWLTTLLVALIMGFTMGATILISQYFGQKDLNSVKKMVSTTYITLFVASIIVSIGGLFFCPVLLRAVNTPPEIMPMSQSYINIILFGTTFTFGYNAISAILRGLGDSKTPLLYLGIATIINIVLDIIFVAYFDWNVAGAALATIIAQAVSLIFGLFHLSATNEIFRFRLQTLKFDRKIFNETIRIGIPSGLQQIAVSLAFLVMQGLINSFGADVMSGFTAGSAIENIAFLPIMNFSLAMSAFTGQNIGAKRLDRVTRGFRATLVMSVSLAAVTSAILYFFAPQLILLFLEKEDAAAAIGHGVSLLRIIVPFYVFGAAMFSTNGVIRGAGDAITSFLLTILTLIVIRIPLAFFLSKIWGSDGILWSFNFMWMFGCIASLAYYKTGLWKRYALK